ncbi:hypothetical protein RvY_15063 [Ramazzottius varieornatus]|uniref:RNA-binding protein 42 n=1 Tax=Ramazzottius varieornatus TaxID=947166 RepID=A0A1D1VTJ6_RAMVA|nr:hypothetical protein RvY_15063 [Ramazzottius varieornatus]
MASMEDEMRRFEMELAGTAPLQPPPPGHVVGPQHPGIFQPTLQHGPTIAQQPMPMRFIPHQLMHRGPVPRPQPYVVHAAPQPAQSSFNPFMPMMPPMFPRMPSMQSSQPSTSTQRTNVQQNTLQVSANKAMLDAQKAMAMQVKEPPVMGPQVTPKTIEEKDLSNKAKKNIKYLRTAGGDVWEDTSLAEFDPNDYRIFCGDLGNEVNDEALARAFRRYPTFQKAKVVRDKKSNKSKGYGFVSFKDPDDFVKAMKEMNGKYVGNRPIKLRKSAWKERQLDVAKKRVKEKQKLGLRI